MKTYRALAGAGIAGLGALALTLVGCAGSRAPGTDTDEAASTAPCGPEGLIDDAEDGNNQVVVREGRAGYWYTFADDSSTVTPAPGGTFAMSEGGAQGSRYAARMQGRVGTASIVYVGMGLSLLDPKGAYDASRYGGIRFYGKRTGGDVPVRIKLPDRDTDPDGGRCQECFNDFGTVVSLTDAWTEYVLPFAAATQEESWGDKFPRLATNAIYQVQWQVNTPGADFDIWIDDVAFVGCHGGADERTPTH